MKVLFIEPCHVNFGGYFRAVSIATALSKKGVDVDLLVASRDRFSYRIRKTQLTNRLAQYELPRFYYNFFFNGRILRGLIGFWFGVIGSYDIIHAAVPNQLESNIPAVLLKILGKKVVMDWDDYWEGSPIYGNYQILRDYIKFCEHRAPRFFKHMVVTSDFLKRLATKRGATHVLKLINGVNTEQFKPRARAESRKKLKLDDKGQYLITFGNTFTKERALLLFETFSKIRALQPNVKLFFNRDPRQLIAEHDLHDNVSPDTLEAIINLGYIPDELLPYYLGAVDATLFLMDDADNERACFPIRIGAYLNGESVIIINDTDSEASNTLKNLHCAIIDKDIDRLARKAADYLGRPDLQAALKARVREAKTAVSWDALAPSLIKFYRQLV